MPSYVLVCYLFSLMIAGMAGVIAFDRLVQLEYRNHREQWEQDGKPWNGLTPPPGASAFDGRAWQRCSLTWLFSTPSWTRSDSVATRLLWLYRGLGIVFNFGLCVGILYRVLH